METKVVAVGAAAVAVGIGQTAILREYVDRAYPTTNIEALGTFGTPSALAGIGGGLIGLGVGAYGAGKGKDGRQRLSDVYVEGLIDYGAAALASGLASGWKPAVTEADCVAAGGFFYNGSCHKTPQTGTVSMAPQVQTSAYRHPSQFNPSYNRMEPDMKAMQQMSAEISRLGAEVNRLGSENASLKVQTQAPVIYVEQPGLQPGTVSAKQARYGFMDPGISPGQPTPRAKDFGFMDTGGRTPLAKVQQMKDRFGFSG